MIRAIGDKPPDTPPEPTPTPSDSTAVNVTVSAEYPYAWWWEGYPERFRQFYYTATTGLKEPVQELERQAIQQEAERETLWRAGILAALGIGLVAILAKR